MSSQISNYRNANWNFRADENKTIGRAHDCAEVHLSDVEKWAEQHPEHSEHWKRMKKAYEESNR